MVRDYGFKLNTLQRIVAETGTTPIFDLNVLTSNLADRLAMLRSASALGIPVRYIELGNEFYLSDTNYTRVFPISADYAAPVPSGPRGFALPSPTSRSPPWDPCRR